MNNEFKGKITEIDLKRLINICWSNIFFCEKLVLQKKKKKKKK